MNATLVDLEAVIEAAHALDPLPASTSRLTALVTRPDVDLREVAQVVSYDQALTARLLRVANSAASASRNPIATVRDAVVRLGSGVVLTFAIGTSAKKAMQRALPEYGLGEGALWRHAVAAALAAEHIKALSKKGGIPPEAFTAALLHDIGRLVLARFLDADVREILAHGNGGARLPSIALEREVLGVDHAELGSLVAENWKLPDTIAHAIRHHHDPTEGTRRMRSYDAERAALLDAICDSTHVADVVAKRVAPLDPAGDVELDPGAMERLGFDAAAIDDVGARTAKRLDEVLAQYA